MKFLNFLKNWIVLIVGVIVTGVCAIVGVSTMKKAESDYNKYAKEYDENALKTKANSPIAPASVSINDDFASYSGDVVSSSESKYKAAATAYAEDIVVTPATGSPVTETLVSEGNDKLDSYATLGSNNYGGEMKFSFNFAEDTYCDMEFVIESGWITSYKAEGEDAAADHATTIEDLFYFSEFSIKGDVVTGEIKLVVDDVDDHNWHSLVLTGLTMPKGEVEIVIKNTQATPDKNSQTKVLPNVRNVTVFADKTVTVA